MDSSDFLDKAIGDLSEEDKLQLQQMSEGNVKMIQTLACMQALGIHQSACHAVSTAYSLTIHLVCKKLTDCKTLEEMSKAIDEIRATA